MAYIFKKAGPFHSVRLFYGATIISGNNDTGAILHQNPMESHPNPGDSEPGENYRSTLEYLRAVNPFAGPENEIQFKERTPNPGTAQSPVG
jgi:hypothetical protein